MYVIDLEKQSGFCIAAAAQCCAAVRRRVNIAAIEFMVQARRPA